MNNSIIENEDGSISCEYYSDTLGFEITATLTNVDYEILKPERIPSIEILTDDIKSVTVKLNKYLEGETLELIESLTTDYKTLFQISCELDDEFTNSWWFEKLTEYLQSDDFGFQED